MMWVIFWFAADREVQRILLELLNQMDGFDQTVNVKVRTCCCACLQNLAAKTNANCTLYLCVCMCAFLRHIACGKNMKVRRVAVHVYLPYFYLNYCAPYNVWHSHYFELGKGNFLLFFWLLPTQNHRLYTIVCIPFDGNWFPSGDHGHQQSRHPWPGTASSWPSGQKDRVPSARPTPEASHLHHHHRQDEHQWGSRPWRLRRTSRQNLWCWYQCYLPGGELVWEYWIFLNLFVAKDLF